MASTIFSGNEVKTLKDVLSLNDKAKVIPVNADPSSGAGVAAPIGSLALDYSSGKIYRKSGSLATEWQSLGSGVGGINYISNPDAESGTTGWRTYANPAGPSPTTGISGSPGITWTRSTTIPLRGIADFNLVKDAVNRQGNGVSIDFLTDEADLAKVLTISFDYEVLSGTYATGDVSVWVIQDPDGANTVLQPAGYQVLSATAGTKMRQIATFQTASNRTNYRLCIHVSTTSTAAYSLAIDSVQVGPQVVQYGAPVTDWQAYTPTFGGVTATSVDVKYRRVGDSIEVVGKFDTSASAASVFTISLPSGLSIDTAKIPADRTGTLGFLVRAQPTSATYPAVSFGPWGITYSASAGATVVTVAQTVQDTGGFIYTPTNGNALFTAGDPGTFEFRVPVSGWSSTVQMSNDTDTRVIAARILKNGGSVTANTTISSWTSALVDTHGGMNLSTGVYTVPVPGIYYVELHTFTTVAGGGYGRVKVDGVTMFQNAGDEGPNQAGYGCSGLTSFLNAGQQITVELSVSKTLSSTTTENFLNIFRLSGPSAIAASETVACEYKSNAGNSVANNTDSVFIDFATRVYDTHGAVVGSGSGNNTTATATWRFVAPISGKYQVNAAVGVTIPSATNYDLALSVWVNGVKRNVGNRSVANAWGTLPVSSVASCSIQLNAGDYVSIGFYQTSGAARTMQADTSVNHVSIVRVGN